MESIREETRTRINEGEGDEVNPWLERTGWNTYLTGLDRIELMAAVNRPDPEEEPVETAIWSAVEGLARFSQETVAKKAGVFVRFEAIRTEVNQTRYTPLIGYQDVEAIGTYIEPWNQVFMFFARTRKPHEWDGPKYRFNKRQRQTWNLVYTIAQRHAPASNQRSRRQGSGRVSRQRRVLEEDEEEERDREGVEEEGDHESREEEKTELTELEDACLEFCIAILDQKSVNQDYDSAMICATAVLGVKEEGWKGTDQYPPILSKLIKIARFLVIQKAFKDEAPSSDVDEEETEDESGDEEEEEEEEISQEAEQERGVIKATKEMMDRFMVRGTNGPMQWMLDLRTYGLKIHYNTTVGGNVDWVQGDRIQYKAIEFGMDEFRGFVHKLTDDTKRQLDNGLLIGFKSPAVPWQSLRDDASNSANSWNFLKDERNRLPVKGERWLFDQIGADQTTMERFVNPKTGKVRRSEVDDYMAQIADFRARLLVLMHVTGGQPARAPELLSIRHSNTAKGEHRNIFIEDGLVVFVTRYHKGYAMSGDVKIIHR